MSSTYGDVDRSGDPAGAAAWMDEMATWPAVQAYKDRTVELLADISPLLDVGCGVGTDARALGAVGIDPSFTMTREALRRGGVFLRGDVLALPVASGALGGVRTDRVLQHVDDATDALSELSRVLRPGGRAVLAEPDQTTLVIDGPDAELTPAILAFRKASINHASLGGELAHRLRSMGYTDIAREPFPIEILDPALAFGLPSWPGILVERGHWTRGEAQRFTHSLDPASFRYCFDIVVTTGLR